MPFILEKLAYLGEKFQLLVHLFSVPTVILSKGET